GNTIVRIHVGLEDSEDLTFRFTPESGECSGTTGTAVLDVRDYNGNPSNSFTLDNKITGESIFRANSTDSVLELYVRGVREGRSGLVDVDYSQIVLPAGVTGTVTGVDLMRGFAVSETVMSNGKPSFFAMASVEGLTAGGSDISGKLTVLYCEYDGSVYIPTLIYHNSLANSKRLISVTNRLINGRDVCQVGSSSRIISWNGSSWAIGFVSITFTGDAEYSPDGDICYFCGGNSAIAKRIFTGSTDANYLNNSNWSSTVITAGTLNTPVANTSAGSIGSNIGFSECIGIARIGFDGTLGAVSGTNMMLAVLDNGNKSIVFVQEQPGTDDMIQISPNAIGVIDLSTNIPAIREAKGICYDSTLNALFVGDGD
ncbi:MAG: hypothetical protein ACPGED_12280, partial [Flavobacteriales bacterium]